VISRKKTYFFILIILATILIACIFSGNCLFDIRQLPGATIAVVGMFCSIAIAAFCLFAVWSFVRAFGELVRGRWVVPARTGFIFISFFIVYFIFSLLVVEKICG
jgi:hypothetical protein